MPQTHKRAPLPERFCGLTLPGGGEKREERVLNLNEEKKKKKADFYGTSQTEGKKHPTVQKHIS